MDYTANPMVIAFAVAMVPTLLYSSLRLLRALRRR